MAGLFWILKCWVDGIGNIAYDEQQFRQYPLMHNSFQEVHVGPNDLPRFIHFAGVAVQQYSSTATVYCCGKHSARHEGFQLYLINEKEIFMKNHKQI